MLVSEISLNGRVNKYLLLTKSEGRTVGKLDCVSNVFQFFSIQLMCKGHESRWKKRVP